MKMKYNNSELAHIYATQSQESAQNMNGSLYFDGATIFSYGYHFPIAKMVTNERGTERIIYTTSTYSNTTAKHKSIVQQATSHFQNLYCFNPCGSHDENFNAWLNDANSVAAKLVKAKKPLKYVSALNNVRNAATKYAEFFAVEIPLNLSAVLDLKDKSEFLQYQSKVAEYEKAETARKLKEQEKAFKIELKKWQDGETSRLYINLGFDYLRLRENRVETTQAVQIPLELAKRLYISIKERTIKKGDKLLNYTIDKVGAQIKIGCHTFAKSYLLKFGAQLN
jgi:hypothetical protein